MQHSQQASCSAHAAEATTQAAAEPCSSHAHEEAKDGPTPRLLQLPLELLQVLWRKLSDTDEENVFVDQLALRCTCRQVRQATARFIRTLEIEVQQYDGDEDDEATCEEMLEDSLTKLAGFPSDAGMTSLRWECWKEDTGHMVLPALLPTFLISAGAKVAAVEELSLSGVVALGCGELSSVAMACPRVRHLRLSSISLVGPALWPLAALRSLQVLTLKNIKLPLGLVGACAPLASLTQVSELKLVDHEIDPQGSGCDALRLEDVAPHLSGLCALRRLKLALGRRGSDDLQVFMHLSQLTQLTSLYCQITLDQAWCHSILDLNRVFGLSPECRVLSAPHLHHVVLCTQLVSLSLPGAALDTDAIRTLEAMKQLMELEVDALLPDEDLTDIPFHWRRLKLAGCQPPAKLLLLSLGGVKEIATRGVECLRWELAPELGWQATAATLRAVSELLAPVWSGNEAGSRYLHLQWQSLPTVPSHQVLSALAPWNHCSLDQPQEVATLFLAKHWDVSEEHVRVLNEHLPNLQALAVSAAGLSFLRFTAAVAAEMPQLRRLWIVDSSELSAATRDALLAMATIRASKGLPLVIYAYGCMSSIQRISCNIIAQVHSTGIEQNQVRFEIY